MFDLICLSSAFIGELPRRGTSNETLICDCIEVTMVFLQMLSRIFAKTFTLLCIVFLISDRKTSVDSRTARGATYLQCPAECSCLGNVVDCSKRALTTVPKSLPDWVESL